MASHSHEKRSQNATYLANTSTSDFQPPELRETDPLLDPQARHILLWQPEQTEAQGDGRSFSHLTLRDGPRLRARTQGKALFVPLRDS